MSALTAGGLESTAEATGRGRTFDGFNGLRAIAAVSIVLTHVGFISGETLNDPAGSFLVRMEVGVSIFFVISGFLLYRPFVRAHLVGDSGPGAKAFWWRRVLRIFPAYWLALTGVWLVLGSTEVNGWGDAITYYGLLQIYDPLRFLGGITQAWSLCTELSFYAFVPLYAWVLRPRRFRPTTRQFAFELGAIALLFATSFAFRLWIYEVNEELAPRAWAWLPANLDLFGFGMLIAAVGAWAEVRKRERSLERLVPPAWLWWIAAAVAFWAVSIPLDLPRGFAEEVTTRQQLLRQLLYGLIGFFLVAPAALVPSRLGVVGSFLRTWPVAAAGAISYGIYLWHVDLAGEITKWSGGLIGEESFFALLAATLVVTMVVAAVSYHAFERPILRLKRRVR